ncbi:hypothetical protein LOC68_07060 [Blastopirellula sp. JC732]|uniref:Uncharacterized protein n=1 Tax=Blastopirellula sediminis TaxID=2894196 RepID=A0A9X1MJY1_9BACT|nr:hypothetical protein [Blastopirellula sediminis]MCC9609074.1 hypothetical protein [Blastopirellula sediminis]MCC9628149.1 hypothetical protein [Blastopirellula sediminis]
MNEKNIERGRATIEMTKEELTLVNNALNEFLNNIGDVEFTTRIAADAAEIKTLLDDVNRVLNNHLLNQERLP